MLLDGFINFLKPPGMSSHDAVNCVRRALGLKKAGHAGTLDPGAAGVLPVAVGRATRLLEYVGDGHKTYRAELCFGAETDSGDDLGAIVAESGAPMPDEAAVSRAVQNLTGRIEQTPPIFSAVKVGGRRASQPGMKKRPGAKRKKRCCWMWNVPRGRISARFAATSDD